MGGHAHGRHCNYQWRCRSRASVLHSSQSLEDHCHHPDRGFPRRCSRLGWARHAKLQERTEKAARESRLQRERTAQEQRAKEEADNRARATAEECVREYAENVARLTKRRDRTSSEAKRCKETAPKGWLVTKTPEEHCRDKIAVANSAAYELRLAEQKTCPAASPGSP